MRAEGSRRPDDASGACRAPDLDGPLREWSRVTNGSLVSGESLPGGRMYQVVTEDQLSAASGDDYGRALDLKSSVDAAVDQQLRSTLADADVDAFGFELAVTPTSEGGLPFDSVATYPAGTTDTLGLLLLWLTNTGDSSLDVAGENPELYLFARCPSSGDCTPGAATSIQAPRKSNATMATFFETSFLGSDESELSYFEWISDSARSLDGALIAREFGLQTVVNPASNDPETVIGWKGSADWLVLEDDGSGGAKAETMAASTVYGDRLRTLFGLHGSSEAYVSTRDFYQIGYKSLSQLGWETYGAATVTGILTAGAGGYAIIARSSREVEQVGGTDTDFRQHGVGASLGNPSSVVVFVHGWQNTASSALDAFATSRTSFADAGYVDPVVGFSWPSDELDWYLATELARRNGSHLAGFLDYYSSINASGDVHVVAHSLGGQVVLEALKYGHENAVDASVASVSLLGAAAEPAKVASGGEYHDAVREEVGHFYNYYNPGTVAGPLVNRILDGELQSGDLQRRAGDDVSDMILDIYYRAAEGHRAIGVVEGPADDLPNYTGVPVRDVPTSPTSHSAYFYPDDGCIDQVVGNLGS